MLILSGVVSFVFLLCVFCFEYKNKSLSIFLWAAILVFFGISHIIYTIGSNTYNYNALVSASVFSALFSVLYLISRFFINKYVIKLNLYSNNAPLFKKEITHTLYCLLLFSVISLVIFLVNYAGNFFALSKSAIYSYRGQNNLYLVFDYIFRITAPVAIIYLINKNKIKFTVCVCSIIAMGLVTFTRTYLIGLFVVLLYYFIFNNKTSMFSIAKIGLFSILAIYFMYVLRAFRYFYDMSDLGSVSLVDLNNYAFWFIEENSGDIFLSSFFYRLLEINNSFDGLGSGAGYLRLLLLPFPSALTFGIKPEDICITLGRLFGSGVGIINYSVTPTLFGDCYANFGFLGFFMGIFWAVVVTVLDKIAYKNNYELRCLISVLIAWAYINVGRGDVYNAFVVVWYGILAYYIIFIIKRKFKIRLC